MRKLSLLLLALAFFGFASAQSYSEDFNNGIPSNMMLIDNDGLTPYYATTFTDAWIAYERATGDSMALSTSWYTPAGTSDDWMITPRINVASGDYLAWEAMAWSSSYADGYVVKLSPTGDSAMSSFTVTLLTVGAENDEWTGHTVDLSSYAGTQVRIAFINNSNDKFVLSVDNIKVFTTQYAVKPVALNMPVKIGKNLAPFDIMGTVVNQGLATITSYKLNYQVNNDPVVSSTITAGGSGMSIYATDDFKASTQWTPTAVGNYIIKVWVTDLNGSNTNTLTDTVTTTVEIVQESVQRLPLFETFTSSTCGPCVAGNANLKQLFAANPNMWTCVKYQMSWPGDGDPYYTLEGGTRRQYYGVTSVPHQFIDGGYDGNSASVKQSDLMSAYYNISYLEINAALTITGKNTETQITLTPKENNSSNLRLFCAIVEKKTTKNVGSNGETEFFWVMKKMVPDANGTILNGLTAGTPINKTLNWNFKGKYRLPANAKSPIDNATEHSVEEFTDLIAVVWVQDFTTKKVLQSAFSSVTIGMDEAERANLITAVYPNPAQDQVNINLNMEQSENVKVSIFNTLGQTVYSKNYGSLSGVNTLNIHLDNVSNGVYFVKIIVGDKMYTKPLQITK